jgi:hypothetical protein
MLRADSRSYLHMRKKYSARDFPLAIVKPEKEPQCGDCVPRHASFRLIVMQDRDGRDTQRYLRENLRPVQKAA